MRLHRILPILVCAILLVACDSLFDDSEEIWDGRVVEFKPTAASVTFDAGSEETVQHNILTQFVAAHEGSDNTVTFIVDSEATTAEEGVHYELINDGSVVIPANSSSAEIGVQVMGGGLEDGESRQLVLELTDDGDVSPSENYKRYTLTMQKDAPAEE